MRCTVVYVAAVVAEATERGRRKRKMYFFVKWYRSWEHRQCLKAPLVMPGG